MCVKFQTFIWKCQEKLSSFVLHITKENAHQMVKFPQIHSAVISLNG